MNKLYSSYIQVPTCKKSSLYCFWVWRRRFLKFTPFFPLGALPLGPPGGHMLPMNNFGSLPPKDDPHQVWLKSADRFWRRRCKGPFTIINIFTSVQTVRLGGGGQHPAYAFQIIKNVDPYSRAHPVWSRARPLVSLETFHADRIVRALHQNPTISRGIVSLYDREIAILGPRTLHDFRLIHESPTLDPKWNSEWRMHSYAPSSYSRLVSCATESRVVDIRAHAIFGI